jgi:hypothetical protein
MTVKLGAAWAGKRALKRCAPQPFNRLRLCAACQACPCVRGEHVSSRHAKPSAVFVDELDARQKRPNWLRSVKKVPPVIRCYEAATGAAAIVAESGETLEKLAARGRNDESDERH